MISNSTDLPQINIRTEAVVIYSIFILSVAGSILLSTYIIWIILCTRALRTPTNFLICNTGLATILYIITSTINITCYVMQTILSDWVCRVQAYWSYVSLTMVGYSYMIQSVSRLFFTVFPRYRVMLTYNAHITMAASQIAISFIIPLPSLVTQDIGYRFQAMCLIPTRCIIHVGYFFVSSYFVPLFTVIVIYVIIYRRVKASSRAIANRSGSSKRELQLIRNILFLFMIFLLSGFPGIVYVVVSKLTSLDSQGFYLLVLVSTAVASVVEKMSLIVLNRELRTESRKRLRRVCGGRLFERTAVQSFTVAAASTTACLRE